MMADKVVMSSFAQLMIHDAWTYAQGNAQELADVVSQLAALDSTIAGIISARSGMELADVKKAMDAETWYTADEALELGLVDEKVATEKRVADALDRTLMGRFKHAPADAIEKLTPWIQSPGARRASSSSATTSTVRSKHAARFQAALAGAQPPSPRSSTRPPIPATRTRPSSSRDRFSSST